MKYRLKAVLLHAACLSSLKVVESDLARCELQEFFQPIRIVFMSLPPQNIRAHVQDLAFEIQWTDQDCLLIPFRELRGLCPCANCVNELSGERTFFAENAAEDVKPVKMELIGNYAVRISWSDGHHTGLFTWDYLRRLSAARS